MKQIITVLALSIMTITQAFGQLTNLTFIFRSTAPDNILLIMEQNAKAVLMKLTMLRVEVAFRSFLLLT